LEHTAEKFNNVYGLVYEPDNNPNAPIEEVRLKVSPVMMPYIQSLPIHSSQSISGDTITLHLIINPELENKIMSYGEHIEILSALKYPSLLISAFDIFHLNTIEKEKLQAILKTFESKQVNLILSPSERINESKL
jgi:hypothetical protein